VSLRRYERSVLGPSCSDACRVEPVIRPGMSGRFGLVCHDPATHEDFGRRMAAPDAATLVSVGPLRIDRLRRLAWVDGRRVASTPIDWGLLRHMAARPETLCTQDELLTSVWGVQYVGEAHLLRVAVSRLRGKLYPFGALIRSHPGQGYLLTADPVQPPTDERKRPARGWSVEFARCVCCGRTESRHAGYGRCERCQHRGGRSTHHGPCGAPPADEGASYDR
jgi:DNA-binding winged helix-turn-helix (wHTH) protein